MLRLPTLLEFKLTAMNRFLRNMRVCALLIAGLLPVLASGQSATPATIDHVALLGGNENVEVEIKASQRITPQVRVLTGPERLVIDFPGSVPSSKLRNVSASRGQVKSIRVGLFTSNPPVTRLVLDLKSPQQYELFPSGKTIIVKLRANIKPGALLTTPAAKLSPPAAAPIQAIKPATKVEVQFQNGKLTIGANDATLAEVLYEVHRKTGADIPIPSGAERDQVTGNFGPGLAREVMASLLNGSRFNFILVASDTDPSQLRSVVLTARGDAGSQTTAYFPAQPAAEGNPGQPVNQGQPDAQPEVLDTDESTPPPQ
jgi:hypothetical protein